MSDELDRSLTTLEHIVLGLIGEIPQSGYNIINILGSGTNRWSASPGSIYPILKRLEKLGCITGELEMVHETRPRKIYYLTPTGEQSLDAWLRGPLTWSEVLDERDIVLIKFLLMEKRLPRLDVLSWLNQYEQLTLSYEVQRRLFHDTLDRESSLHQSLIHEATLMEINMQHTWIQMARRRLEADLRQHPAESTP